MKKTILAALFGLAASAANAVPVQWTTADGGNGNYYEFVSTGLNWFDAAADAASRTYRGATGYLVTITSAQEQQFINGLSGLNNNLYWLGGSDAGSQNNWTWRTGPEAGQAFTYTNWAPGEPNNFAGILEDHVVGGWGNRQWNDIPGGNTYAYVVEYTPAPVPLPAGFGLMLTGLGALAFARRRKPA